VLLCSVKQKKTKNKKTKNKKTKNKKQKKVTTLSEPPTSLLPFFRPIFPVVRCGQQQLTHFTTRLRSRAPVHHLLRCAPWPLRLLHVRSAT
jgi:hypothetical protein